MKRHDARRQAFFLLFEQSLHGGTVAELIDYADEAGSFQEEDEEQKQVPAPVDEFAQRTASGAEAHCAELDEIIGRYARGWSVRRISKVCLALLRLALYEMKWEADIPVSVSINEAVELAKQYGGADDASFLNGILGAAAKELQTDG
ncbi:MULTISPECIES: transcription antitermination factor NusB [Caproicibacterium]|uniref:Transcription antitermination protein NusB n=1 Tax=Caproicibacterium argilliputei TaxID=3030016 RepID=A0AA97DCG3_9FIRM|nr:transcription antitermination factor NusB [Caproicibacterium argilliputei]WOC33314.1 transcription antitermination factor NusB [Caproicibacterium argilliputei]